MSARLRELTATELAARSDAVLSVYAEAMKVSASEAASRRSILAGHLRRSGFRAHVAVDDDGRMVGVAYGYLGAPGQWWHDKVADALTPEQERTWLDGAFEVCELHVRPADQGTGLGRSLLAALLVGPVAPTAILTTPDADTRARRFYRQGGWVDLRCGLRFPGDPRVFAVLGLRLTPSA